MSEPSKHVHLHAILLSAAAGGALLSLAAVAAAVFLWTGGGSARLPVIGPAPQYRLTDQNGKTMSSQQFAGKVRIVAPLFPYCRELCPLVAADLAEFDRNVVQPSDLKGNVVFMFFNVAPEAAGPPALREFLQQYGWSPDDPAVEFLTGSPEAIRRVVEQGYHVAYYRTNGEAGDDDSVESLQIVNRLADRAKVDFDVKHADVIEVVDREGRIRKIFTDGSRVSDVRLRDAVASLLPARIS